MNLSSDRTHNSAYLSVLLEGITTVNETQNPRIDEICLDSRVVRRGSLFFAVPGINDDGRVHIERAIEAGASAVVFDSENWSVPPHDSVPQIGVPNLARKISAIADVFFQQPSLKLHVVGITGTNGKSSCAILTAQALEVLGQKSAIIGTLGYGFPGDLVPLPLTTPDSISLQRHIAKLARAGAKYLCLEVSSHSLAQSRTDGVRFGTVAITNVSRDHLDYHPSEAHYRASKSRLFTETSPSYAVLNVDDDLGRSLQGRTSAKREITYGERRADVQLIECIADQNGLHLQLSIDGKKIAVQSQLLGRINGINLTTVAAILHSLGHPASSIETALQALEPVSGRLEQLVTTADRPSVYVDYAHTPDALQQALVSLRAITRGQLWCVFGCGGDRDVEKRPQMGAVAERYADQVILTDDNPRSESPALITSQIQDGMQQLPTIEHDRRQAIELAIYGAKPEDAVLIAGKGHETVQIYSEHSQQFSDRDVAYTVLGGSRC